MPVDYTIPAKFGQLRTGIINPATLASLREAVDQRRAQAAQAQQVHDLAVAKEQRQNALGDLLKQAVVVDQTGRPSINVPVAQQIAGGFGTEGINALHGYMQAMTPPGVSSESRPIAVQTVQDNVAGTLLVGKDGDRFIPGVQKKEKEQKTVHIEVKNDLAPEQVDFYAGLMLKGQDIRKNIGSRGELAKARLDAISKRMSEIAIENGLDAGAVYAGQVQVSGAKKGYEHQTVKQGDIAAFEGTAQKVADMVIDFAKKGGGNTNVPLFNHLIIRGKYHSGDPEVVQFNAALRSFKNEYAKIMSGATGAAGSTDTARLEASELINEGMTYGQLLADISAMKKEMEIRVREIEKEKEKSLSVIGGSAGNNARKPKPPIGALWGSQ